MRYEDILYCYGVPPVNKRYIRIACLLVTLALALPAAAGILPARAEGLPGWACAYTWFLLNEEYMNEPEQVIRLDYENHMEPRLGYLMDGEVDVDGVALRDLDCDGIPELLLKFMEVEYVYPPGADIEDYVFGPPHSYIYTFRNNEVICVGIGPGEWLVTDNPEYPGLFGTAFLREDGESDYYWSYYWLNSSGNYVESDYDLSPDIGTGEMVVRDLGRRGITPYSTSESDPFLDSLNLQWLSSFRFFNPNTEPPMAEGEMDWLLYLAENYGIYSSYLALESGYEPDFHYGTAFSREVSVPFQKDPVMSIKITFSTAMFQQYSEAYHRDIAELAILLSTAAYEQDGYQAGTNIYEAYEALGFQEGDIRLFNYPDHPRNMEKFDEKDHFRFSIASQDMGEYVLLVIVMRGTGGEKDKKSDANVDTYDMAGVQAHAGFNDFRGVVCTGLEAYLKEHREFESLFRERKVKVLITGHSLGGAAANLLGAYLMSDECQVQIVEGSKKLKIDPEDLFVYTYACPRTIDVDKNSVPNTAECFNIFNIVIDEDPVANAPLAGWWHRFGRTYVFATNYEVRNPGDKLYKLILQHRMDNYIWAVIKAEPIMDANTRMERWHDVVISDDPR